MVAYSFKSRFVTHITVGAKRQTIRSDRKRHARAGEEIQLYTAMRTRSCRLIGRAVCLSVSPIRLVLDDVGSVEINGQTYDDPLSLDGFARRDGFSCWEDLRRFWAREHGSLSLFSGVMISWGDLLDPNAVRKAGPDG